MTGTSSLLGSRLEGYGLESGDLWLHSLAVALGSRLICKEKAPDLSDDAFMAGLLHDAGKLILDRHLRDRMDALESLLEDDGHTFLDAERRVLGFDHSEIASEACAKWQIPDAIGEAVRHHHHPSRAQARNLACIVHVADLVALMSGIGGGIDGTRYKIDRNALELLDISPEDINHYMPDVMEGVKEITQEM
jgi:HD-like signal output (HDOD) protein